MNSFLRTVTDCCLRMRSARVPLGRRVVVRLFVPGPLSAALVFATLASGGRAAPAADLADAPPAYGVTSWQSDSGLPQNSVQAIVQTRDGYLWVGTKEGLARFNGAEFTVFNENNIPGLTNTSITALLEGADGSLWIGTDGGGLVRMKAGHFQLYSTDAGLVSKRIRSLRLGPDGSVWIGTTGGVNRFKDGRFAGYTDAQGLVSKTVHAMAIDRTGAAWIGTSKGANVIRNDAVSADPGKGGLKSNFIHAIYEDREGALWIATNAELECRKDGARTRYTVQDGIAPETVECIYQDRGGTLWFGTNDGLYCFDHGRFASEAAGGALLHLAVLTIAEDRERDVWIGTPDGLKQIRASAFASYTVQEGLSHNVVTCVAEDRTGALWVGTTGGGLNRLQNGAFSVYRKEDGLISDHISALHEGRDGSVWIGFDTAGLSRFESGQFAAYPVSAGAPNSAVNVIYEDHHGTVWFGTGSGLAAFREGKFTARVSNLGGSGNIVRAITEDRDGVLWIGSNGGVTFSKNGQFTTLTQREGLSRNSVTALYADQDGMLWIGTDGGGLNWIKDGKIGVCTTRNGLFSDTALAILEDDRNVLWMSSRQGIFSVARQELVQFAKGRITNVNCIAYGKADGMPAVEGSSGSKPTAWKSHDGRLWFATVKGLGLVNPASVAHNDVPPPVVITQMQADRNAVSLDAPAKLPPGRGELEFRYAALSFAQPEKVQYQYRLEGVDVDWVEAGARRIATYSGVKPGWHRFRVIARNNDGVWNRTGASYDFYLTPYFYETWWFYSLVGILVAGTGCGAFWLRIRSLRLRERQLAALVQERTKDLNQEIAERRRVDLMRAALLQISDAAHESADLLAMFRRIHEIVGGLLSAQNFYIALHDEATGLLSFPYFVDEFDAVPAPRPPGNGLTGMVLRTGQPQLLTARAIEEMHRAGQIAFTGTTPQDWLGVPLVSQNRKTGVLTVQNYSGPVHYTEKDLELLLYVSRQIADAIERKRTEEQVAKAQRELLDISRQAGMAEVATGVLHNVGNVLNSVNVSASVVMDRVRDSKTASLARIAAMLQEHAGDLAHFLCDDPKGQKIPGYLIALADQVAAEQKAVTQELAHLVKNVDHIKDIVAMQQSYAKVSGVAEKTAISELAEDALQMNASAMASHGLTVVRAYEPGLVVTVERYKVLQILVNLIRNAKNSCDDSGRADKQVTVRTGHEGNRARIEVVDNGVGIRPENLVRIFAHGFTTRKDGHGFGLHSGALVARELGGTLTVHSDGPGLGATFTLELPWEA